MTVRPFLCRRGVSAQASTRSQFQMDAASYYRTGGDEETATSKAQSYESVINHNPIYELPPFLGLCIYMLLQL